MRVQELTVASSHTFLLVSRAPLASGALAAFQAFAFAHSPALLASFERWRAAVEVPSTQRALPDPTITYAGFVSSVETRVGPMRHRLGIRQWFPWPSSVRARSDAAVERAEAAQRIFEAHALSLGGEVARAERRDELIRDSKEQLGLIAHLFYRQAQTPRVQAIQSLLSNS